MPAFPQTRKLSITVALVVLQVQVKLLFALEHALVPAGELLAVNVSQLQSSISANNSAAWEPNGSEMNCSEHHNVALLTGLVPAWMTWQDDILTISWQEQRGVDELRICHESVSKMLIVQYESLASRRILASTKIVDISNGETIFYLGNQHICDTFTGVAVIPTSNPFLRPYDTRVNSARQDDYLHYEIADNVEERKALRGDREIIMAYTSPGTWQIESLCGNAVHFINERPPVFNAIPANAQLGLHISPGVGRIFIAASVSDPEDDAITAEQLSFTAGLTGSIQVTVGGLWLFYQLDSATTVQNVTVSGVLFSRPHAQFEQTPTFTNFSMVIPVAHGELQVPAVFSPITITNHAAFNVELLEQVNNPDSVAVLASLHALNGIAVATATAFTNNNRQIRLQGVLHVQQDVAAMSEEILLLHVQVATVHS